MSVSLSSAALAPPEHDESIVTACYTVVARTEPGVMPRVVELFAKRGLVPQKFYGTASLSVLTIDVQIGGLSRDVADYIGRCMRQIVGVETVLSSETRPSG